VTANGFDTGGYPVNVRLNYAPAPGTVLTMVNNTGLGFIHGSFGNLAQGQRVTLNYAGKGYDFVANYYSGSGNDLVLQWADTKAVVGLQQLRPVGRQLDKRSAAADYGR